MIASAVLLFAVTAAAPQTNACVLCHPESRVLYELSVHHAEGISCTDCHGGDQAATDAKVAHGGDWKGVPARRDIPQTCARCHSDVARMRPYNLPSDQFALYQTSQHGLQLAKGEDRVAVCIDCHGTHDIRRRIDPASRVNPRNVPTTCARCHSDAVLMAAFNLPATTVDDYYASVHGKALLEQGNLGAPGCSSCHGAHGATPPGFGDVDKVCGQCHAATREYFDAGPHLAAMRDAQLAECASCHSNHRIVPTEIGNLKTVCVNCHDAGSSESKLGENLLGLYQEAETELADSHAIVKDAAAIPLYVGDYEARLEEARTTLMKTLPIMHSLDLEQVEEQTSRVRAMAQEVRFELDGKLNSQFWRRIGLLVFWFYLVVTLGILIRIRKRIGREIHG